MRKQTLQDIIEQLARAHFGVGDLSVTNVHNVSSLSIKTALAEAIKAGERIGYDEGYSNAKETCECDDTLKSY